MYFISEYLQGEIRSLLYGLVWFMISPNKTQIHLTQLHSQWLYIQFLKASITSFQFDCNDMHASLLKKLGPGVYLYRKWCLRFNFFRNAKILIVILSGKGLAVKIYIRAEKIAKSIINGKLANISCNSAMETLLEETDISNGSHLFDTTVTVFWVHLYGMVPLSLGWLHLIYSLLQLLLYSIFIMGSTYDAQHEH